LHVIAKTTRELPLFEPVLNEEVFVIVVTSVIVEFPGIMDSNEKRLIEVGDPPAGESL
jgi:hypothetical protein